MAQERETLGALATVRTIEPQGADLALKDAAGATLLRLAPATVPPRGRRPPCVIPAQGEDRKSVV